MTYHNWNDNTFDWQGLNNAMEDIRAYVYNRTLCRVIMKEKYGSIRYEYVFPPGLYSQQLRIKLPFFKKKIRFGELPIILFSWHDSWLYNKWASFGLKTLVKACMNAVKKYPHLEDEILEDLASNEELVGKKLHDKYWTTYTPGMFNE